MSRDPSQPALPLGDASPESCSRPPSDASVTPIANSAGREIRISASRKLRVTPVFDTFWKFAEKRQALFMRRRALCGLRNGVDQSETADPDGYMTTIGRVIRFA